MADVKINDQIYEGVDMVSLEDTDGNDVKYYDAENLRVDYSKQIENKPKINGVELDGDKTIDQLGFIEAFKQILIKYLIKGKVSGKAPTIDDATDMSLLSLTVNDEVPVETVKCIGKNFFHRDYDRSVTHMGVTVEWDAVNQEFIFNGTTTAPGDIKLVTPMSIDWVIGENYTVSVRHISGTVKLAEGTNTTTYSWGIFQDNASKYVRGAVYYTEFYDLYDFTAKAFELDPGRSHILYFQCWRPGTVFDNYRVKVQIEKGDTVTDWEAYREKIVTFDNVQSLELQKGYNNIVTVPSADITVEYVADTQMYIDKQLTLKSST